LIHTQLCFQETGRGREKNIGVEGEKKTVRFDTTDQKERSGRREEEENGIRKFLS